MRVGQQSAGRSDYKLDTAKSDDAASLADWRCNKSHPAALTDRCGTHLSIQSKAALVFDCISAKALHRDAGMFGIQGCCLVTTDPRETGQSENVIDAAGPRQGVVDKIAFPAAGMMRPERSDLARLKHVDSRATEEQAELEPAGFLVKRPTMAKREGLGWMEHTATRSRHNDASQDTAQLQIISCLNQR